MLLSAICLCFIVILSVRFPAALIFITVLLVLAIALFIIKKIKLEYIFVLVLSLMTVFSTTKQMVTVSRLSSLADTECKCEFTVENITYENINYNYAEVRVNKSGVLDKGTKLSVSYSGKLNMGDIVSANLTLNSVSGKYRLQNYSKGIYLKATAENYKVLEKKKSIFAGVGKVRDHIKEKVFGFLEYNEASTLVALLFGERGYFTNEFYDNVKRSGVSHVMVVSGMHLTIFVTLVTFGAKKLFYSRYICAVLQLFAVLVLSLLCGFTMSILRAGFMYVITSVGLMLKRKGESANSLGAACSLILAVSPFAIFNVAFQLSVLSTFGILSVASSIRRYLYSRQIINKRATKYIVDNLLTSFFATLLTLPVAINIFGFISTVGVITTLIITPLITICIWISILGLLAGLFWESLAEIIFIPCNYLLKFTNFVINKMGELSFSVVCVDKEWVYITTAIIIAVFCVLLACKKRFDMIKLKETREKIINEGGGKLKWR